MKGVRIGEVVNVQHQTVAVTRDEGECSYCGSSGVPLSVRLQYGAFDIRLSCELATTLAQFLLEAVRRDAGDGSSQS